VPARLSEGQFLWDELAALTFRDRDLATWQDAMLSVDATGRLSRDEAGRPVRIAVGADRAAVESALLEGLRRGPGRLDPFVVGGRITASWDGTRCTIDVGEGVSAGVTILTFENTSGTPAGVLVAGVRPPHPWADLVALLRTLDLTTEPVLPDWVIEAGEAGDESGTGAPVDGSMSLESGTYGPVCLAGAWPDLTIVPGEPFEVAEAR
jgi:hypothetical protein